MIGDIGFAEMGVIAVVAVVVFGPDKLPELAVQAAAIVRKVRAFAATTTEELRTHLGDEYSDLELRDLDPRVIVRKHIVDAMERDPEKTDDTERDARDDKTPVSAGHPPAHDADTASSEPPTQSDQ